MHIATPIKLIFKPNTYRHTINDIQRFREEIDIKHNVKACIGENEEDARQKLFAAVKEEWLKVVIGNSMSKSLEMGDFDLFYSCDEVKNGRVWCGGGVGSYKNMK